jgi:hypothetical protein
MAAPVEFVGDAIRRAIVARADAIIEEETLAAMERARKRIRELAPTVAAAVFQRFEISPYGDKVQIMVSMDDRTKGAK